MMLDGPTRLRSAARTIFAVMLFPFALVALAAIIAIDAMLSWRGRGVLAAAACAAICTSCTTEPYTESQRQQIATAVSNIVLVVTDAVEQAREDRRDEAGETGGEKSADPVQPAKPAESGGAPSSAPAAPPMDWRFGGFNGSRAAEDPETQIKGLRMSRDGMSYQWAKGNLGNWGLSREEAGALACAFYWDGKRWVGGKFDWISTSRQSRDFENIHDGYNGWVASAFFAAPKRAFCIVSEDGCRRTNLLVTEEPR